MKCSSLLMILDRPFNVCLALLLGPFADRSKTLRIESIDNLAADR